MIVSWLAVAQMDKLLFGIDYFLHIYIKYIFNQKNIIKLLKKIIKILKYNKNISIKKKI